MLLVSTVVMSFGNEALVTLYFLIVVPYSFDRGRSLGQYTAILSTLAFLGSSWLFTMMNPNVVTRPVWTVAAAACSWSFHGKRCRSRRSSFGESAIRASTSATRSSGILSARAESRFSDELGFLQRSFNRMLEQLGGLIGTMQREAEEVAAAAEQLAGATHGLNSAGTGFTETAQNLTTQIERQRAYAVVGRERAAESTGRGRSSSRSRRGGGARCRWI